MPSESHRASEDLRAVEALRASWRRSAAAGLVETTVRSPTVLSRAELLAARERSARLVKHAEASMENTRELIEGTSSVVLLADPEGILLSTMGQPEFTSGPEGRFFVPGSNWAEGVAGTNAVGTCIASRAAVTVETDQHYLAQHRNLYGAAAPIFDSAGLLLGVLGIYGSTAGPQSYTVAFLQTVARLIENRLLVREMASEIVVYFHPVAEYIGTIKQGIAAFSRDGRLLATNSAGRNILRVDLQEVPTRRFRDLFCSALPLETLVERARAIGGGQLTTSLKDGREVTLTASVGAPGDAAAAQAKTAGRKRPTIADVRLKDLDLGDPLMQRAIAKASMILGSDIPLLIEGESGVGKEIFTAAFHNSGPRQNGPFVAVNCAAIPEGLIESELFGYEEGAFTGAKKRGHEGRLVQADKGTLFLDEIGDMPLALQGRLLRVLQERQVTPLGSTRSTQVDVSLVCATHRNLRAEVDAGRFREDLYYRLNGLRVQLPALRQRKDIDRLIDLVIETESGGRAIQVAPEVRNALRTHAWPGNIRQLQMVLRTAIAILGSESQLTLEHLPDDIANLDGTDAEAVETAPGDLAHVEFEAIRRALAAAHGNVSQAARSLGISRKTLYRKIAQMKPGSTEPG